MQVRPEVEEGEGEEGVGEGEGEEDGAEREGEARSRSVEASVRASEEEDISLSWRIGGVKKPREQVKVMVWCEEGTRAESELGQKWRGLGEGVPGSRVPGSAGRGDRPSLTSFANASRRVRQRHGPRDRKRKRCRVGAEEVKAEAV